MNDFSKLAEISADRAMLALSPSGLLLVGVPSGALGAAALIVAIGFAVAIGIAVAKD